MSDAAVSPWESAGGCASWNRCSAVPLSSPSDDTAPFLSTGPKSPKQGIEPIVVSAGDEMSFDDVFEHGQRENSFDHRRSRSVLSLDDIPEDQTMHSVTEKPLSTTLMHSCTIEEESETGMAKLGPSDFEILAVIGQGAFGKVFQVKKKDSGQIYAMKVMKKESILEKDHAQYVWSERDCLTSLKHPYIVQMYFSFQTKHKLYLILEFLTGGHLFYQLYQKGCFTEQQTRFYAAELISAVSFLHGHRILHRDLKPENVLLDRDGHIKVTDFGLSKGNVENGETRASSFVGTLQYMAPEVIHGKEHTAAVDWWSIGILVYEMINGEPPFDYPNKKTEITETDRKKLMNRITAGKIRKPRYCSDQAWSLIQGLLCKDASERQRNGERIRSHPFFKKVKWDEIDRRCVASPFQPESKSHISNVDQRFRNMPAVDSPCSTPNHPNVFQAFQGYSYATPSALRKSVSFRCSVIFL